LTGHQQSTSGRGIASTIAAVVTVVSSLRATADDVPLEELTVTARRIEELRLDVPLSIDVIADDGGEHGSDSVQGLVARVPGFYYEAVWGGVASAPTLRGQQPNPTGDPNVAVFVDGVYQSNPTALDAAPIDVARIEVVRGPQNALFGRSTFAGALHYVGNLPTESFESGIAVDLGSDAFGAATGYLSGPVFARMLGRVAVGWRSWDGGFVNSGTPVESLGGWQRRGAALTLATDRDIWSVTASARFTETTSTQPATSTVTYADYNCGAIEAASGAWSYLCEDAPLAATFASSPGIPDSDTESAQLRFAMKWLLTRGTLEVTTSVYRGRNDALRDFDGTNGGDTFGVCTLGVSCGTVAGIPRPIDRFVRVDEVMRNLSTAEDASQEVLWRSSDTAATRWSLGAAVWRTNSDVEGLTGFGRGDLLADERLTAIMPRAPIAQGPLSIGNLALVADPNGQQVTQSYDIETRRSVAVFGTVERPFAAHWTARAELRATEERRALENRVANFGEGFGTAIPTQEFSDVTPRFSVQRRLAQRASLYVSAAKGSQSGGINALPGLLPAEQTYDPEYNWTYEIGGRYFGEAFTIDGTLYRIDWRNAQLTGFAATPGVANLITLNTAGLVTRGFELAVTAAPSSTVGLELAVGYIDGEYRSGSDDPGSRRFCGISGTNTVSTLCTIGPARVSGNGLVPYIDGNQVPRAPTQTWHAGLQYTPRLPTAGRISLRADVSGQDDVFERSINGVYFGARVLVDARIVYALERWSVALWGRNLRDERYVRALSSRGQLYFPTTPRPLDLLYGDPRRYGITVTFTN
jgi:iron complex outermembrane receptor protein